MEQADDETSEKERIEKMLNIQIKNSVSATIRKFSKCKDIQQIKKSVDEISIKDETVFINKLPGSFYKAVSKGIHSWHDVKTKDAKLINKKSDKQEGEKGEENH